MFEDALKHDRVQSAASKLAKMLRPYKKSDGRKIEPHVLKLEHGSVSRGYCKEDFGPAWERYLPPHPEKPLLVLLVLPRWEHGNTFRIDNACGVAEI